MGFEKNLKVNKREDFLFFTVHVCIFVNVYRFKEFDYGDDKNNYYNNILDDYNNNNIF